MWIVLGILFAIAVISALWIVGQYNRLIVLRNRFRNAYAQIDVQLKRRYDLIPNLVETAKAYLQHERGTLEAVIQARNQASTANQAIAQKPENSEAMKNLMGAEAQLTGALGRFFALAEAYPDLKANQNMAQVSEELSSTENKIAFARQSYNDSVMSYNNARESFPTSIMAGMFNFREASLFEIQLDEERKAPKVSFGA